MLELINVCKTFNPGTVNAKTALNDLNLTLNDGDFVTVIGGNGAGKSTMLNAIAGSFQIDSGKIVIDGTDVTGLPEHKRAALLGRVFQDPMMGHRAHHADRRKPRPRRPPRQHRGLKWGITKAERAEYQKRLHALNLGLEERMTAKVGLLSRRPAAGADAPDGGAAAAEAAASRRAHRRARPAHGSQGA